MAWYVPIYDALVQAETAGFVLLALASLALATIRQPARRIRVIELTLVGLLAIPFLALVPGYPRVSVLPELLPTSDDDDNANGGAVVFEKRIETRPPAELGALAPMFVTPSVDHGGPSSADWLESIRATPPVRYHREAPTASPQTGATVDWQLPRDFRFWIVTGYLAGMGAMIVWSLIGLAAMARLLRCSWPAGDGCCEIFREIAGQKSAGVALLVSPRAGQPCALVWRRPTIVLPEGLADSGDERQLCFALAHEWSHIARGDVWTWGLSSVVRWLYFYQPLVWLLRRQLRLCQDYLADAAAARSGGAVEDYAEFLTSYASCAKRPNLAAGLGIASGASELRRRIVMLVENRQSLERVVPRRWNLVALPLAVLLLAAVTSLGNRPSSRAAEPPPAGSEGAPSAPPTKPRPAAAPQAAVPPADTRVETDLENDPIVQELTRHLAAALVQIAQAKSLSPGDDDDDKEAFEESIKMLQRQVLQLEVSIDERKAQLRPKLFDRIAAEQDSDQRRRRIEQSAPRALRRPSEATIEIELDKDPAVVELLRSLAGLQGELAAALVEQPNSKEIKILQRTMEHIEQFIEERKAILRPRYLRHLTTAVGVPPFRGRIRPGDIIRIDLEGGFPTGPPQGPAGPGTAMVEPDGNVVLGALYGGRIHVAGATLSQAEEIIDKRLVKFLKDPHVQVTYEGHNPDIAPAEPPETAAETNEARRPLENLSIQAEQNQLSAKELEKLYDRLLVQKDKLIKKLNAARQNRPPPSKRQLLSADVNALRALNDQLQRYLDAIEN